MDCGVIETKMHYLWCKSSNINKVRTKHIHLLKTQIHALQTYPGITTAIIKILTNGFVDEWIEELDGPTEIDKCLYTSVKKQQALGLNSLAKDYLNDEWGKTQRLWMNTQKLPQQQQWTKNIIITLHTYAYSTWKSRNDILHKESIKDSRKKKREKLQQRVSDLYGRGRANLTQKELNYFKVPVAVQQKRDLKQWHYGSDLLKKYLKNEVKPDRKEWMHG